MKKRIAAFVMGLAFLGSVSGCGAGEKLVDITQQLTEKHALEVDGQEYMLPQARVYLANYQNLYGKVSGVDLWKTDKDHHLEAYVKDLSISQMTKILSMTSLAKSKGLSLDGQELAGARKAAKAYSRSLNEAEKKYLAVSDSELEALYEDYALAVKLYHSLIGEIDAEVSDDEARIMEAFQIVVSDRAAAKAVNKELRSGADFLTVASNYNQAKDTRVRFGRGDLPAELEKKAFSLENGERVGPVKSAQGYYYLYCVNKFDQELTDIHKEQIIQQREKEAFGDVFDAYSRTISKKIYQKNWDRVQLDVSKEIVTDSFFEVFQEYCGDLL